MAKGGLLLRAGQADKAEPVLRQASELLPSAGAELLLALALHKQGKSDEGRKHLNQARLLIGQGPASVAGLVAGAGTAASAFTLFGPADAVSKLAPDVLTELDDRLLLREAEEALAKPGK